MISNHAALIVQEAEQGRLPDFIENAISKDEKFGQFTFVAGLICARALNRSVPAKRFLSRLHELKTERHICQAG
jgi:hypothetical protein